jgi:hypothetical protein
MEKLVFDADEHVQKAVRLLFERFRLDGTAHAVAKYFAQHNLQFPSRHPRKEGSADMRWKKPLSNVRVLRILQNPIYAGAYAYGRKSSIGVFSSTARSVGERRGWTKTDGTHSCATRTPRTSPGRPICRISSESKRTTHEVRHSIERAGHATVMHCSKASRCAGAVVAE